MTNKALLEVDDSILRNNLLLTEKKKEDEDLNDLLRSFENRETPSVTFRPFPGACIKCKTEDGEKVFINICHTTEIPPPEDLSDEKFFDVLAQDEPTWCIPMSIGHERFEEDKGGAKCLTYDVALNTKYYEKCQTKKAFWTFTILTVITAVSEKHEKLIKAEFTILKNRKVMGKLHDHRAQKREPRKPVISKPLIEEITVPSIKSKPRMNKETQERKFEDKKTLADPQYVVLSKPKDGKVEHLIGYFKLPNMLRMKDLRVDVCDDRIIVEAPRMDYLVDVFVPHTLDQDKVEAVMDKSLNVLRLNIPVI